jgi:hypothetical protein
MKQNFAAIILRGTGQVGGAAVAELLAFPECREMVMVTRKPIAARPRMEAQTAAGFRQRSYPGLGGLVGKARGPGRLAIRSANLARSMPITRTSQR